MADPFEDDSLNPPRYKFVRGRGDSAHESLLNSLANKKYKATQMVYDPNGFPDNLQVVVLMERE